MKRNNKNNEAQNFLIKIPLKFCYCLIIKLRFHVQNIKGNTILKYTVFKLIENSVIIEP